MDTYIPQKIEKKWQKAWEKSEIYRTPDRVKGKKNFYCLDMFPYPSGEGLHVGHLHGYIGSDIVSRYLRMKGFNVLHPMGFDAFGLPAENAAIIRRINPRTWTQRNIKKMRKQLKSIGAVYDWSREVITAEPDYYKWTQWMFLELYRAGLAYRSKVPCNFCPSCKTVLANEQVIDGKCERCSSRVLQEEIEQWLFRITSFVEDLLKDLKGLDWPETTKMMQRNWIGKSEGTEIKFQIANGARPSAGRVEGGLESKFQIEVFTTRPDTLFGATYLVLAPEHPLIENFKSQISNLKFLKDYIDKAKKKTERERISEVKDKTGIEIKGIRALNPANNREISIFIADYVLSHYGKGAIMSVPAHDQRDFDFARKYNLPVIEVIKPRFLQKETQKRPALVVSNGRLEKVYEGEGFLINSGRFNGMESGLARERITEWLAKKGLAKKAVFYKLRDWLISRQRYWGSPIPMTFCHKCGWQPLPEKDLPVLLPRIRDFKPTGEGKSPLDKVKKFLQNSCPKCRGPAERETDTMDTFVCSSWYFLRYADPQNSKKFASKQKLKTWLPVDLYVGGAEHACLHLLYARFFSKVLRNAGRLDFKEPFLKLRHQGIILGPDGQKMSKSRGNVIPLNTTIQKYGIDTVRLYEMFIGPFSEMASWSVSGIEGCSRFLQKVWNLFRRQENPPSLELRRASEKQEAKDEKLERLLHQTIKKVTEDIEDFRFNTAISALMILVNQLTENKKQRTEKHLKKLLLLSAPFAPHLTEELWQKLNPTLYTLNPKYSVHNQSWPKYDEKLTRERIINLIVQINGRVRDKIEAEASISKKEAEKLVLSREKIKKWTGDKKIKKIIFIPKKLINIVI